MAGWGGTDWQMSSAGNGTPPEGNANSLVADMIYHLSPKGKIFSQGSIQSNGNEVLLLENIIEDDLIECIIAMPQPFYSQEPGFLWILNRAKKQKGKTLFIDARNMGEMVTRAHRELTEEDITKIANTYKAFVNGNLEEVQGYSKAATIEEMAKQDYILTPGRYVGIEEEEDDGIPFEEKMENLTTELSSLFEESRKLEDEIRERLKVIGYEV